MKSKNMGRSDGKARARPVSGMHLWFHVAPPSEALSLLDIRSRSPSAFPNSSGGWFIDREFASGDQTTRSTFFLRILPRSLGLGLDDQLRLISEDEYVPNVADVAWAMVSRFSQFHEQMFQHILLRTSSVPTIGMRIGVGMFGPIGIGISAVRDNERRQIIGLAVARKEPQF